MSGQRKRTTKRTNNLNRKQRTTKSRNRRDMQKRKGRNRPSVTSAITALTPISTTPIQVRSLRYTTSTQTPTILRYVDIQCILSSTTEASTSAFSLIGSIRILSIGFTVMPDSSTGAGTFTFSWTGDRSPHYNDTLIFSQGAPSKFTFRPPEDSYASFWVDSDFDSSVLESTTLCEWDLNGTADLIVDIHFEYIIVNGIGKPVTLTGAAAFSGIVAPSLGFSVVGGILIPVGLDTAINSNST